MQKLSKYELLSELGRGTFAVVYRARDTILDREVALKVLNPNFTQDPQFAQQFIKEAQTAANFKHTHIVTVHDAGEDNGRLFLAMELVDGMNLRDYIKQKGVLPFALVVSIVEQVASALSYAHERGMVHRDVKSANIMVDDKGNATLTDFGLVRAVEGSTYDSSLSLSGGFAGTVEYISPEQVQGEKASPRSDLYALGVVAYEMITGDVPFKAETPIAVAFAHVNTAPRDPKTLRPDLPNAMRDVVLKAIAKKPDARYKDVMVFAKELRDSERPVMSGSPHRSQAEDVSPEKLLREKKQIRQLVTLAVIMFVLVGVGSLFAWGVSFVTIAMPTQVAVVTLTVTSAPVTLTPIPATVTRIISTETAIPTATLLSTSTPTRVPATNTAVPTLLKPSPTITQIKLIEPLQPIAALEFNSRNYIIPGGGDITGVSLLKDDPIAGVTLSISYTLKLSKWGIVNAVVNGPGNLSSPVLNGNGTIVIVVNDCIAAYVKQQYPFTILSVDLFASDDPTATVFGSDFGWKFVTMTSWKIPRTTWRPC